nr:MAG TPA: hypothetical protein [Caudoviricetes sp.]
MLPSFDTSSFSFFLVSKSLNIKFKITNLSL